MMGRLGHCTPHHGKPGVGVQASQNTGLVNRDLALTEMVNSDCVWITILSYIKSR